MTDKELSKLGRNEFLEMLLDQSQAELGESLRSQLAKKKRRGK